MNSEAPIGTSPVLTLEQMQKIDEMISLLPTVRTMSSLMTDGGASRADPGKNSSGLSIIDRKEFAPREQALQSSMSQLSATTFSTPCRNDESQVISQTKHKRTVKWSLTEEEDGVDRSPSVCPISATCSPARSVTPGMPERRQADENGDLVTEPSSKYRNSSVAFSVMQHITKGMSATRRGSESSDDDSERDHSRQRYVKLSRDVYSLMYFSAPCSIASALALFTFGAQVVILTLIVIDIVDPDSDNPLNIPAGASAVVRVAQFFAVLIAVATQDDLITSFTEFHLGCRRGALTGVEASSDGPDTVPGAPGGAKWQWLLSVLSRALQGGYCLVVTFFLIIQSVDVVGLFLDFLAVTFVSTLDDVTFALAREGYFGKRLRAETLEMTKLKVPSESVGSHWFRPALFLTVSVTMLICLAFVAFGQMSGRYMSCVNIEVQFGDEYQAALGFFSGTYTLSDYDANYRPVYFEQKPTFNQLMSMDSLQNSPQGRGMFAYCQGFGAWTFSYPAVSVLKADPCNDWMARSVETQVYDILEISSLDWFVYGKETEKLESFQHFSLHCVDCDRFAGGEACNGAGVCADSYCVCDESLFGRNCEFAQPCPSIKVNTELGGFPGPYQWSERYNLLNYCNSTSGVKVYGHPVYISDHEDGEYIHVMMYTGRRWALTTSTRIFQSAPHISIGEYDSRCNLAAFFATFHAHWVDFRPEFISAPSDIGTPTASATPVGLAWFRALSFRKAVKLKAPIATHLICAVCDQTRNPCQNKGECLDGICKCKAGTYGALCQIKSFTLCKSMTLEIGSTMGMALSGLRGIYQLLEDVTVNGRDIWVEKRWQGAAFAYCKEEAAWTLTVVLDHLGEVGVANETSITSDFDPCASWLAKSPRTESHDITTLGRDWLVCHDTEVLFPIERFFLWCNDCEKQKVPCHGAGVCGPDGSCNTCNTNNFGVDCGNRISCTKLVIEQGSERFEGKFPGEFHVLYSSDGAIVELNTRPVYFSSFLPISTRGTVRPGVAETAAGVAARGAGYPAHRTGIRAAEKGAAAAVVTAEITTPDAKHLFGAERQHFSIIFFGGQSWYATSSQALPAPSFQRGTTAHELANFLSSEFHTHFSSYEIGFISEPIDILSDVSAMSPVKLRWYEPDYVRSERGQLADLDKPVDATFQCAFCNDKEQLCGNGGACVDRKCSCLLGMYGSHCQISSICRSLSVAFGSSFAEKVQRLSGIYDLSDAQTGYSERPVYFLKERNNALLAYCFRLGRWTFTFWEADNATLADIDPCANYLTLSSWTNSFDILSAPTWFFRSANATEHPVAVMPSAFDYVCNDPYYVPQPPTRSYWDSAVARHDWDVNSQVDNAATGGAGGN